MQRSDLARMYYREFVQRYCQETSRRGLEQRPCEENRGLDLANIFLRELEQRSYLEISYRDLAWRSLLDTLDRFSAKGFGTAASTETLSRRFCPQSSAEIFQNLPWYLLVMFLQHCLGSLAWILVISLVGSIPLWVLWILFLSSFGNLT